MRVGFLGMGRMGTAMAGHVLRGGDELAVWNRTPGRAGDLVTAGAVEVESPAAAARGADAVVLMLRGPDDSRAALLGVDGVVETASAGTLIVNATTIDPETSRSLAADLAERGLRYLDAPVAGSVKPATEGTLRVLVGASEADFAAAKPLLERWGDPDGVRRVGEVGAGSALKLVINLTLGVAISGIGEALRLARDLDVDQAAALEALASGPFGWTLAQKRPMIESQEYTPTGFSLDLLAKDLGLCLGATTAELSATAAALDVAHAAIAAGHGQDDYAALAGFLAYEGNPNSV